MKQSGFGIAGLILGLIGMCTTCIFVGIFPCILGLIFSIIGMCSKNRKKGVAIAGMICSLIGILIFGVIVVAVNSPDKTEEPQVVIEETISETISDSDKETVEMSEKESAEESKEESVAERKEIPEILFCNIPWGTCFSEVDEELGELGLFSISGENYKTMSVDDIVLGDYQGIDFDYSDINIIGSATNCEIDVAGYTPSDIKLFFAYIPVDGVLTKEESDSAMYGAQYAFEPKNTNEMEKDLVEKLTSLYGTPTKTSSDADIYGVKYYYTFWDGANNTQLVLKKTDASKDSTDLFSDEIVISYVWNEGDVLLQNASDILKKEAEDKEADVYGNGQTNGL